MCCHPSVVKSVTSRDRNEFQRIEGVESTTSVKEDSREWQKAERRRGLKGKRGQVYVFGCQTDAGPPSLSSSASASSLPRVVICAVTDTGGR